MKKACEYTNAAQFMCWFPCEENVTELLFKPSELTNDTQTNVFIAATEYFKRRTDMHTTSALVQVRHMCENYKIHVQTLATLVQ